MRERALLFFGGVAFGTAAIFVKFCSITPPYITLFRFLFAGLVLLLIGRAIRKQGNNKNSHNNPISLRKLVLPSLFLSLHMVLFVFSVFLTTIAASTILVSTSPIFAMIFKRRVDLFVILAILGIVIMNLNSPFGSIVGNLMAVISALSFALYTYFLSKIQYDFFTVTPRIYIISSAFMVPVLPFFSMGNFNLETLMAILGLVFIPTIIGHGSVIYSANKVPISLVTSAELIEPVVATLLAFILFSQVPSLEEIVGGVLTLISLFFAFRRRD
ncbi:DMT family transporter [Sulfolobus acidocaldarius]|uniref:Conserved Crenarchaeal protein n=4 Tax=Sulfolobus acidocaldarius TaxID=2285 RepID=Q4J7V6_SULAC|nr:DMT family transporter [Sulfolobus acidocaldarius]AAY81125.1 conserved Crenarchaeal protein [Sulfolobus acidocaldarius DSM 639]AGE71735.1 hypothetical protein SacN8_08875 [Sulfolobus acidocaldarius N8]AGE74008.1 hypothetical protein SacRon12I_08885 [Sulfolobus acidocaldarius Ron12/I]ALU30062.1 hypothetical protein ATY89_09025 [Sulfolobus acidocaldarius]ALU30752.1 hypothetical protein ATZ20_00435 [Sulfolobus acidocaldarius]